MSTEVWFGAVVFDVAPHQEKPYYKAWVRTRLQDDELVCADATARCPNRALGFALAALGAELAAQKADPIDHPSTRGNA